MSNVTPVDCIEYPSKERLESITREMLDMPQSKAPVVHRFGPGVYIRQLTLPAGSVAIGQKHKFEHINVMLTGRVTVLKDDGKLETLVAPLVFLGKPGQKIGYIQEEVVWLNVFATDETDIEKLEDFLFEKSDPLESKKKDWMTDAVARRFEDRLDFFETLAEIGVTQEQVRKESEDESNLVDMPLGEPIGFIVSDSPIEGRGVFASIDFKPGDIIGPSRLVGAEKRTTLGRFINHAKKPNSVALAGENGEVNIVAVLPIEGSHGGTVGDEITLDYRQAFEESNKFLKGQP